MSEQRTFERIKYTFNADEIRELGEALARETVGIFDLEQRKSATSAEINAQIKQATQRCGEVAGKITAGYELRQVECLTLMETPRPGLKRIIRIDTGEAVRDEPMTLSEMQTSFGFAEPDDNKPAGPADDANRD